MAPDPNWTDIWQTIFSGGQLVLVVIAAIFGWHQLKHARELREEQTRPFVVIDLAGSSRPKFFDLVVTNIGATIARDVKFEFDPPVETSSNYPDIYKLKAFKEGFASLPPGKEFRTLLDFGPSRFEAKLPDTYRVKVSYRGTTGEEPYEEVMDLDFGVYWNRTSVTTRDVHDVHTELKAIAEEMRRWRPGIGSGLLAVDLENLSERHEQAQRDLEEYRSQWGTASEQAEAKPGEEAASEGIEDGSEDEPG